MATSWAAGKSRLIEPAHGTYQNEWELPCNSNFDVMDATVSGITTIDASVLTPADPSRTLVFDVFPATIPPATNPLQNVLAGQNLCVRITGTLSVNMVLYIPSGIKGFWFIDNRTTGNFIVTVKTNALTSSGVVVPQTNSSIVYSDGTNVIFADSGTLPPIATDTTYGIVTQGLKKTNCVPLDNDGKIPYQTDKYIISTNDPDPAQGSQDWLWMKV